MTIYLSENIKRFRLDKGLTQETLAQFLGVTFQSVSKWERGESYPDVTMLPAIASFFNVSVDELLGIDKSEQEEKINEYLDFYNKMRLKDTPLTLEALTKAVKEFPGEFRLLVRYMELLMAEKTSKDAPDYEKVSHELLSIYDNIRNHCSDDGIRMWAKRLICQHLHTKAYYTGNIEYQEQAEQLLNEMPAMIDTKEYLSTMLIADMNKHYEACSDAIEQLLFLLQNAISHYCNYDDSFSPEYKIEAMEKMNKIYDIIYTDGNLGKNMMQKIYNLGHLGYLYLAIGDRENALKNLELSAKYSKEYDNLPQITERQAQFFENRTYEKDLRGKTMCERMKFLLTERYPLSAEFKSTEEFKAIIEMLG
ncbi:MAG: helix-turn-helix transcriptional regulator [Clostridia bacterium]|nr:helix-turn-helix transcriptional regulator [Clostridia bacterium]